jgi:hypothetical protein
MALKSPVYLDSETLLAYAEYHDVDVPHQAEIVETASRKRNAGGTVGLSGLGIRGGSGTEVEYQSSYRLEPNTKATISRVIDALQHNGVLVTDPDADTPVARDDLFEIDGLALITTASVAGKMLYLLRRLMQSEDLDLNGLQDLDLDSLPEFATQLKQIYLGNELLPIPLLLEFTDSTLLQRVYVNVNPDHFIDSASASRVEGRVRIIGNVTHLIPEGDEGYLSSEEWLLHDWENMMKRHLMVHVDSFIREMMDDLDLELPEDDVRAYLTGPAIVINAVAIF